MFSRSVTRSCVAPMLFPAIACKPRADGPPPPTTPTGTTDILTCCIFSAIPLMCSTVSVKYIAQRARICAGAASLLQAFRAVQAIMRSTTSPGNVSAPSQLALGRGFQEATCQFGAAIAVILASPILTSFRTAPAIMAPRQEAFRRRRRSSLPGRTKAP